MFFIKNEILSKLNLMKKSYKSGNKMNLRKSS